MGIALVWLRLDLRLRDHGGLGAAARAGLEALPVYAWSPEEEAPWEPGGASRWWLHHSLTALSEDLRRLGGRLVLRRGPAAEALATLARETNAEVVFFYRRVEPWARQQEARVQARLADMGIRVQPLSPDLLIRPDELRTTLGGIFQVFTPFWKAAERVTELDPAEEPLPRLACPAGLPSLSPSDLNLLPRPDWAGGLRETWTPGEAAGRRQLEAFLETSAGAYLDRRDRMDLAGTGRLSPHLHFGEISARTALRAARSALASDPTRGVARQVEGWIRQLYWREFAHYLLYHFTRLPEDPLREAFRRFPWREDEHGLRAWQRGRTGYPTVDAAMRELWHTGWMHNRARMIVASFLVKDLMIPWQAGARWFWDTLVDADLANNTLGWQWTAGCGPDAAPYFRVFNPVTQGKKFDPEGTYARRWIPALAEVPTERIHEPWLLESPPEGYHRAIVAHEERRALALEAYASLRDGENAPVADPPDPEGDRSGRKRSVSSRQRR
ncbi:MAG TPA: deoxyribodipyrimidine photo-lyase [Candidatus Hydrogenedentes bacterium]|nr:deoxyribodipyrimidine photo-lyase [Candidatus Hydrogenedentota bacterium]